MDRPPRDPSEPILPRALWWEIGGFGTLITASVLSVLAVALTVLDLPRAEAVTLSFLTLAFAQLWHVFNMRAPRTGWVRNEVTRNPWVWGAVVLCIGLLLGAVYVPTVASVMQLVAPSPTGWLLAVGASLVPLFLIQLYLSIRPPRRSTT